MSVGKLLGETSAKKHKTAVLFLLQRGVLHLLTCPTVHCRETVESVSTSTEAATLEFYCTLVLRVERYSVLCTWRHCFEIPVTAPVCEDRGNLLAKVLREQRSCLLITVQLAILQTAFSLTELVPCPIK